MPGSKTISIERIPLPKRGPIELQTHGGEIRWRNVYLKELSAPTSD